MKLRTNEFIKRYYDDDLSSEELEFFKEKVQNDIGFKEEVQLYEQVFGDLVYKRARNIQVNFKDSEFKVNTRKSNKFLFLDGAIKRCILLFLLFVLIFSVDNVPYFAENNSSLLFGEYFKPYPNVIAPINRSSEYLDSELSNVMVLYETRQYEDALLGLNTLIDSIKDYHNELLFYKGLSLLASGNSYEAVSSFELMDLSSDMENQRKWYLSLALGQSGDVTQAKSLLNNIISDRSHFMKNAEELLDKLSVKE